jgi:hypothetical protein
MVNENLSYKRISKGDALDAFKRKTVRACMADDRFLLDVGSGSGAFLWRNRDLFKNHLGIEITPACIEFSRMVLKVIVAPSLPDSVHHVSVVTFWHSLEHLPAGEIQALLARIASVADTSTRLIISVPNSRSFFYRLFGRYYPYFDEPNHHHQFSAPSLEHLLSTHGFTTTRRIFSFAYSFFAYLQGLLNLFCPVRNYLYHRMRRGRLLDISGLRAAALLFYNILLSVLLAPLSLALCIVDRAGMDHAAVITVCARISGKDPS